MNEKENNRIKVDASMEHRIYFKDNWGIIKCSIEKVRSGDGIYKGDLIIFKGQMPQPIEGCIYTIIADFVHDPKWGDQYVIQSIFTALDFGDGDDVGKKKYLSSLFTPYQIDCMYGALDDPFEALKKRDMKALVRVKGCGLKTATVWCHRFHEHYDRAKIYIELENYGLTNNVVNRLMSAYHSADLVVDKIKNNPYVLVNEVNGISWKKADEIALKGGIDPLGETRVAEYIKYYLKRSGDNGMSWLTPDQLLGAILDEIGEEVEDSTITKAIKGLDLWFNDEKTKIGLPYYRELSEKIARELLRIKNAESDFKYDGWEKRIKELEQEQGWKFTNEQTDGIKMGLENNVLIISGGAGCVDCDTEFFTGVEWKRIADYQPGDKVLQYNENGTANLVEPLRYIKQPAQKLYHFETKYGLDQTLSLNHNVYYESCKGVRYLKPLVEIQDKIKQGCFHGKFLTTFNYSGTGIDYTDDELRLMVAVFADGSFYGNVKNSPNAKSYKRCRFHLKKERKKERLEYLLFNLGCSYRKKQSTASGYDDYYVDVKERMKHFPKDWYNCTQHQLKVIIDEIVYWDCDYNKKNKYSTNNKEDADFVQFAFSATGKRASIAINDRNGQDYHTCGKAYVRKSIDYGVTWTDRTKIGMTMDHRPDHEITKLNEVKTTDGFEYCFTVPSHLLVLRRNNKIFITGNCGKTSLVGGILAAIPDYSHVMCALSGRASARLAEVTGETGYTIHRLLGYSGAGFKYNQEKQLGYDIYILDEISMVDAELFYYLIRAIPSGSKLIMLGDPAQLEAIGCGNVAYDMIQSKEIPDILLTKIHRQAAKSAIITNSTAVRHGEQIIEEGWTGVEVRGELQDLVLDCYLDSSNSFYKVMEHFQRLYTQKDFDILETQVIVPVKKRGDSNTYNLNNDIQELYNPARDGLKEESVMTVSSGLRIFRVGDKVINTVNNYKVEPTIYNGNIGIIKDITIEENEEGDETDVMIIDFVGIGRVNIPKDYWEQLDLAYAITVHKYQGSQSDNIIFNFDFASYGLLSRQLIYTGITRAKKKCYLVCQTGALRYGVAQEAISRKQTHLQDSLYEIAHPKLVF